MNKVPWGPIVFGLLLALAASVIQTCKYAKFIRENASGDDSSQFNQARATVIRLTAQRDDALQALKRSELARADQSAFEARKEDAYRAENRQLRQKLAAINTTRAGVPELDSLQFSLYGPAPDDSTHTIPLDYSRKLTGDALRMPIEQRLATRAEERLDSVTGHYTRIIGSYKVDLETARQVIAADEEAINGIMAQVGDMQGKLNEKDRKFRRQRRRERLIEGLIVVGVIILTL